MTKVTAVILSANIYLPGEGDECEKHLRGDQVKIDEKIADEILEGDEAAGREPRITVVKAKRGRPRANS